MKVFIGQAVTGEDFNQLQVESDEITSVLKDKGFEVYCNLKSKDDRSAKEQMFDAFSEIDSSDVFLGIVRGERRSEGMILEVGYVLAKKKKLVIAVNSAVKDKTYLDEMADVVIIFDDFDDLKSKLKEVEI